MVQQLGKVQERALRSRRGDRGFTLIEMIVVLIILAAVAGLVIPALGMIGRSTDMAVTAHHQGAVAANLQEFFILQKRWPQGMDSLLTGGTAATAPATSSLGFYQPGSWNGSATIYGTASSNLTQITGFPKSGPDLWECIGVLPTALTANQFRSLDRGGFTYVYDHQNYDAAGPAGEVNANMSAKFRRNLTAADPYVGPLTPGADTSTTEQRQFTFLQRLVPNEVSGVVGSRVWAPEAGTRIVAFGVGQNCSIISKTSMTAPIYPGCDGTYYGRYIAFYKVFETGERAVLLGVSDSYGRFPDYSQQQFNESLPNGSRQG